MFVSSKYSQIISQILAQCKTIYMYYYVNSSTKQYFGKLPTTIFSFTSYMHDMLIKSNSLTLKLSGKDNGKRQFNNIVMLGSKLF